MIPTLVTPAGVESNDVKTVRGDVMCSSVNSPGVMQQLTSTALCSFGNQKSKKTKHKKKPRLGLDRTKRIMRFLQHRTKPTEQKYEGESKRQGKIRLTAFTEVTGRNWTWHFSE